MLVFLIQKNSVLFGMKIQVLDKTEDSIPTNKSSVGIGGIYLTLGVLCWSGSTIVYKSLEGFPSYLVLSMRYILATVLLGLLWVYKRGYREKINRKMFLLLLVLGFFGIAFHNLCIFVGVALTSASLGAIIIATAPIMAQFLGILILNHHISLENIGWSIISLVGVLIVIGLGVESPNWLGIFWLIGAAFSLAFFNVCASRIMKESSITPNTLTFITVSLATIPFVPFLFLDLTSITMLNTTSVFVDFWLAILYLVIIGNIVGRSLYNVGVKKGGSTVACIIMNFSPVFTGFLAFLFLKERPTAGLLVGGIIVIIGAMGIIRAENRIQGIELSILQPSENN